MAESTYGLRFKCMHCQFEGQVDFGKFRMRITGGVELLCPECSKITNYIGRFGHEIRLDRVIDDIKTSIGEALDEEKRSHP